MLLDMRIAMVAPVFESVPPVRYGGTERVVHWLAQELVRRGHDVTTFASGDSQTAGRLVAVWPRALRLSGETVDANAIHASALLRAMDTSPAFDVIHAHVDWVGIALARSSQVPIVTTIHNQMELPQAGGLLAARVPEAALVAISHAQRRGHPEAGWIATIHHGLPMRGVPFHAKADDYLAFVGRISPEKRPDIAIRAARAAGIPLRMAAKVKGNPGDAAYWHDVIEPLLAEGDGVELVGEISDAEKPDFMGRAKALLFPADWPEPFGLVAIEAMSFGTPVIATPRGALPEIVQHGRTGFLAEGVAGFVAAIRKVGGLERGDCRHAVETHFAVERMTDEYEAVYRCAAGFRPAARAWPDGGAADTSSAVV